MRRARSPDPDSGTTRKVPRTAVKSSPSHKSLLDAAAAVSVPFSFKTTKNTKVWANNYGAVARAQRPEYRQFINRDSDSKMVE